MTSSARYQVSPVTQRLVVNNRIGSPDESIAIAARWQTSSRPPRFSGADWRGNGALATASSGGNSGVKYNVSEEISMTNAPNHAALGYLRTIGAADRLVGPVHADFPFVDLKAAERWTVKNPPEAKI